MPQASDELRAKFPTDRDAFAVLGDRYSYDQGGMIHRHIGVTPTEHELEAIQYLVEEWDYGTDLATPLDKLSDPVIAIAKDMQYKLNKNFHKGCPDGKGRTWETCTVEWLIGRIRDEVKEIEDELAKGNVKEARLECADVANFAMMIHDKLGRPETS